MKVRALGDNQGYWEKGDEFEITIERGICFITCHSSEDITDLHALLDKYDRNVTNPADCPDFEVIS